MIMKRRGISTVVASVLIILITVASVAIVWTAVIPMIKKQTEESAKFLDVDVSIETSQGYTVYDPQKKIVSVQVRNTGNTEIPKLDFIFDVGGVTKQFQRDFGLEKNKIGTFYFALDEKPTKVSIAPIIISNGKEEEREITSSVNLISEGTLSSFTLYNGLVSYWRFEDNNFNDLIGNNPGIGKNGISFSQGRNGVGNSASFDGTDDYISVADSNSLDFLSGTSATFAFWAKFDSFANSSGYMALITKGTAYTSDSNYEIWIRSNGSGIGRGLSFYPYNGDNGEIGVSSLSTGNWYHIVFVLNGSTGFYYLNGSLQGSTSMNFGSVNNIDLKMGKSGRVAILFKGQIDEVMLFNKALSQSEVQEIYNSQK